MSRSKDPRSHSEAVHSGPGRRALGTDLLAITLILSLAFLLFLGERRAAGISVLWVALAPWASAICSIALVGLLVRVSSKRLDTPWIGSWLFLIAIGVISQQRLRESPPTELWVRDVWLPIGATAIAAVIYLLFRNGRFRVLCRLGWLYGLATAAILGGLLLYGARYRGAFYGPGLITPTEPIKVLVALLWASYLTRRRGAFLEGARWFGIPRFKICLPVLFFGAALAAALAWQRDLGMVVILGLMAMCGLSFASGKHWHWILLSVGIGLFWSQGLEWFPHGAERIDVWMDPFADPTNAGWQTLQGLSGMYAGGFWGTGLGTGEPERVPTVNTDFVYAALGEELGFLGSAVTVLAYAVLVGRGLAIARRGSDPFGRMASALLVSTIGIQALLNLGGVTKAIPLTGVALPFVSHGGASMITSCAAVGLILAISEDVPAPKPKKRPRTPRGPDAAQS